MVIKTCTIETVAFVIATNCTDFLFCKNCVDSSDNPMLKRCKNLTLHGSAKSSYHKRLMLLKYVFIATDSISDIKVVDASCDLKMSLEHYISARHYQCSIFSVSILSTWIIQDNFFIEMGYTPEKEHSYFKIVHFRSIIILNRTYYYIFYYFLNIYGQFILLFIK